MEAVNVTVPPLGYIRRNRIGVKEETKLEIKFNEPATYIRCHPAHFVFTWHNVQNRCQWKRALSFMKSWNIHKFSGFTSRETLN